MQGKEQKAPLGALWNSIQSWLFPELEDELGELSKKHRLFIAVCEMSSPDEHMGRYRWCGIGCPPHGRLAMFKAFVAKAVWNFGTTRMLLDAILHQPTLRRLCGWESVGEVPSESTFSRAFAEFSADGLAQKVHGVMVKRLHGDKLVGHVSRDSTAIHAREKAAHKPAEGEVPKQPRRRGRRRRSDPPATPPEPTRLQRQLGRGLHENIEELPSACSWGCKRNSRGRTEYWRGYKAHLDVADGDIPISFILSAASMHDSQAAIPLAQMSAERIVNLYDLADAAYDAREIRQMSERLGHVALIDRNARRAQPEGFSPAEAVRYRERNSVERVNSHLHDEHGGRHVWVRGAAKVAAHLSFGLLVIAAEQMLRMLL